MPATLVYTPQLQRNACTQQTHQWSSLTLDALCAQTLVDSRKGGEPDLIIDEIVEDENSADDQL